MTSPWPHQLACGDALDRTLRVSSTFLGVLPTAAGKTRIIQDFFSRWTVPGRKFLFVVNRLELVTQTYHRFRDVFPSVSVYSAGFGEKSTSGDIIIGSIQSLNDVTIPGLACIVFDEVHNFSNMGGRYGKLLERHPGAKVVGVTATPWNHNKPIYGDDKFFKKIDFEVKLHELIEGGYILPPIFKAPPHQFDTDKLKIRLGEFRPEDVKKITLNVKKIKAQVADAIPRLVDRNKILWVCASIEHASLLYDTLRASLDEDIAIIHSKQSKEVQGINKNRFENTSARHMVCVMMATEGYDYPAIDAICFMRPTRSAVLFTQVIGRALRLFLGKVNALILDYGRIVEHCGPLGAPKNISHKISSSNKDVVKYEVWACPKCLSYVPREELICADCGYEKTPEPRDVTKNLTTKASSHVEVFVGPDTGEFEVLGLKVKNHVGVRSKKPSIHFSWKLKGRLDFDEYITINQWPFKWFNAAKVLDLPRDSIKDFNATRTQLVIQATYNHDSIKRLPSSIMITKNAKGFYSTTLIFRGPDRE